MDATESCRAALRTLTTARAAFAWRGASAIALLAALAGCATTPLPSASGAPAAPVAPPLVEPPPPPVNLQGFPLAYRQGFGDGCSTARGTSRKDATRFGSEGNYRLGWQDGAAQCRTK